MEIFYIYWSNYTHSAQYKIARLIYDQNRWYFKYNANQIFPAIKDGFRPFPDLPDIDKIYESKNLFKVFQTRYQASNSSETLRLMKNSCGDLITDTILINYVDEQKKMKI